MYAHKASITYIFRLSVKDDLKKADKGLFPKDYFYFYHHLRKFFRVNSFSLLSSRFTRLLSLVNDFLLRHSLHFNFPFLPLLLHVIKLRKSDIIFATTPKIGLAVALLKKINVVRSLLVVNIVGLYDQLGTFPAESSIRRLAKSVFQEVDVCVSGASWHEAKLVAKLVDRPLGQFQFIPHSGIDTDYFFPIKIKAAQYILGIGLDPSRDWALYRKVAEVLPHESFVWATDPKIISSPVPTNVQVIHFSTSILREKMRAAKLVLILTRPNHHFSGQASALRAMSCGKTVILTKTVGIEEFPFNHLTNSVLVKSGNLAEIVSYIKALTQKPSLSQRLGRNAVQLVRQHYSYEQIGQKYVKLFQGISNSRL